MGVFLSFDTSRGWRSRSFGAAPFFQAVRHMVREGIGMGRGRGLTPG
jgi:hypothetical protein